MDLYTEVHGPASGETVVLSSGLGGSASYWSSQIPALVNAGYRVIAYDQRGTGRSAVVLPADHYIEDMARDVKRILDTTRTEKCHFVGHALGGLIGLQLAPIFQSACAALCSSIRGPSPIPIPADALTHDSPCWTSPGRVRMSRLSQSSSIPRVGAQLMRNACRQKSTMHLSTFLARSTCMPVSAP